jgi:uncharacterized protein (UPF0276 family)
MGAAPGARFVPVVNAGGDVGISLRPPHHAELLEAPPAVGFIQLRSEDFIDDADGAAQGGDAQAVLQRVRALYPVSLLGTGLALGSVAGPDPLYLGRLARLIERIEPVRVADQLGFARGSQPIAYTEAALARRVSQLTQVQERLRRPLLVENVWSLGAIGAGAMSEPEFFAALCRRSGCGMLLDVNTLMVNALNADLPDPLASGRAFIDALPPGIVGEVQVGGHTEVGENGEVGEIVIANRGSRVRPEVWQLCAHALERFGPVPVLVEWDVDLPALEVLLGEATHAARLMNR